MPPFRALHVRHVIGSQESGTAGPRISQANAQSARAKERHTCMLCRFAVLFCGKGSKSPGPPKVNPRDLGAEITPIILARRKSSQQRKDGKHLAQVKYAQTTSCRQSALQHAAREELIARPHFWILNQIYNYCCGPLPLGGGSLGL
jgi:hypothetical protein